MKTRNELYRTTEYWLENIQNDIFRKVNNYMEENNLNKAKLAEKLGFSRAYITQVLNGEFNFSLKKLIELSLALNQIPVIDFENIETYTSKKESELDFMENGLRVSYSFNDLIGIKLLPEDSEEYKSQA